VISVGQSDMWRGRGKDHTAGVVAEEEHDGNGERRRRGGGIISSDHDDDGETHPFLLVDKFNGSCRSALSGVTVWSHTHTHLLQQRGNIFGVQYLQLARPPVQSTRVANYVQVVNPAAIVTTVVARV
jgi:hypothetical protein